MVRRNSPSKSTIKKVHHNSLHLLKAALAHWTNLNNKPTSFIEQPVFFKSPILLKKVRILLLIVLNVFYWSSFFVYEKLENIIGQYLFFTYWGETMVIVYLLFVILAQPISARVERAILALQHAVLACQVMIVLIYWGILFPSVGWAVPTGARRGYHIFGMIYKHILPFLGMKFINTISRSIFQTKLFRSFCVFLACIESLTVIVMLHECLNSRGSYKASGVYTAIGIFGFYSVYNFSLYFLFDIIVYNTKFTSPASNITFV